MSGLGGSGGAGGGSGADATGAGGGFGGVERTTGVFVEMMGFTGAAMWASCGGGGEEHAGKVPLTRAKRKRRGRTEDRISRNKLRLRDDVARIPVRRWPHLVIARGHFVLDNLANHMFDPAFPHPEFIDREPVRDWSALGTFGVLLKRVLTLILFTAFCLPFWPLYLFLRIFMPRPPVVVPNALTLHCIRMILMEYPPHGPTFAMRLSLLLELTRRNAADGFWGFAWFVDEIIWGRELKRVNIVEPLFELSAARSGSTQLARYLEDDPHLCAPSALQEAFPYMWLWRVGRHLERFLPRDWDFKVAHAFFPPEHHERHELDPMRMDTFEIVFLLPYQLGNIFVSLGPRALLENFPFSLVHGTIRNVWENELLRFIDAIGRKTLLHASRNSADQTRRLFIKGHFLNVAPELAKKYPDARFLTMVRAPEKRFQSLINFIRCGTTIAPCRPTPWAWIVEYVCTSEVLYCEMEMAWYESPEGPRRCVVRFDDYVKDLEGTMRKVYRECLDRELSPHVPRTHAARTRTNYSVDRSLEQLGVDEAALKKRLEAYGRWCKSAPKT